MSTGVTVAGGAERFVNMPRTVTAVERKGGAMTSIQPELWVETPREAVAFYEAAFGATVLHRVGDGEDVVAQLGVGDAAFWGAATSAAMKRLSPRAIDGATSRTLLVVDDPERIVRQAVAAGATERAFLARVVVALCGTTKKQLSRINRAFDAGRLPLPFQSRSACDGA